MNNYPVIASKHRDIRENHPQYCFFYPIEEYDYGLMEMLGEICKKRMGEIEVHLHHDNDTSNNLRDTLLQYKEKLHKQHGLLSRSKITSEIKYGFIHGNWALDNSRPDGRGCGVNDEISVLQQTGCYADFTMPSAPSDTQTRMVNSIYYAIDDPTKPKSHDMGFPAVAGSPNENGLLCIQGPLCFNLSWRKWGILPRIENGCLSDDIPISSERIKLWVNQFIHVQDRPDIIFIKLYTHGAQENIMDFYFQQGALGALFSRLNKVCKDANLLLYYVSPRQMYNVVKGIENQPDADLVELFDFELALNIQY